MGRVARGNRAVNLTGDAVPNSLMDISVNENADIYEEKLRFWDGGHDHTGGRNGAIIDLTDNLIYNGNFEYSINPSGAPDFWESSGNIEKMNQYDNVSEIVIMPLPGGYYGKNECLISGYINAPNGRYCLYQDIPPPSGRLHPPSPSGTDFRDKYFTFGCWASGVGELYLGVYDGYDATGWDYWSEPYTLTDVWKPYQYSHLCGSGTDRIRALFCVNGSVRLDSVQGTIGTRLVSGYIQSSPADTLAWRGVAHTLNNYEPASGILAGNVVVLSSSAHASFKYPASYGEQALGISLAPSTYGYEGSVLTQGVETINIYGPASRNELLYAGVEPDCMGYAVSKQYIDTYPAMGLSSNMYPIGFSLQTKAGNTKGTVLAYINPVNTLGGMGNWLILPEIPDPDDVVTDDALVWHADGSGSGQPGDIFIKIHQGGDPGENRTYKLVDWDKGVNTSPIQYNHDFMWVFKMVDATDYATPETGKSPAVTISQNGAAFAALTGAPVITEISNGWYYVTVAAADMVIGSVILKATADGCAQEDMTIYM